MPQDVSNYNVKFYTRNIAELRDWKVNKIRLEDMGSAIRYALGATSFEEAQQGLTPQQTFPEQVISFWAKASRKPKFVLDIGCGRGEVCSFFTQARIKNVGIDPSPGAAELFTKTMREWVKMDNSNRYFQFWNVGALEGVQQLEKKMGKIPDTVMLTESIEHIPKREFKSTYKYIVKWLTQTHGLLIIVNWLRYHPIKVNPKKRWCHVTEINDRYYDWLASFAKKTVFRRKSHLVLQF